MLNSPLLPQKISFLPALMIPGAHWYFFITFCLLKCLYSVTIHIHVEKAVHRVRVLSPSRNLLLDLIKTSESELYRQ